MYDRIVSPTTLQTVLSAPIQFISVSIIITFEDNHWTAIYIDRISKVDVYIDGSPRILDNFKNMKLWFKRWMEQGYEGIELILCIA